MFENIKKNYSHIVLITFTFLFFILSFVFINFIKTNEGYSFLAYAFSRKSLSFLPGFVPWEDIALFQGKYYWPHGPFPAVLLLPFSLIFKNTPGLLLFFKGLAYFGLVLVTYAVVYKIAKLYKYSDADAMYLAYGFCFSSSFLGVIMYPLPSYFSHVVTCFFLLLSIYEFLTKKRYLVIGFLVGFSFATRVPVVMYLLFFVYFIVFAKNIGGAEKLKKLYKFLAPCILVVLLLMHYNFARFGQIFETGYTYTPVKGGLQVARSYGLMSFKHIPGSLYHMFLATPKPVLLESRGEVFKSPFVMPDPWGMSIFFISPYLIYLFSLKYEDKFSKTALWVVILIVFFDAIFFSKGYFQFGSRFSLDFFPLLFVLLIRNYKHTKENLSGIFKGMILFSSVVNLFLYMMAFS